MVDPGRETGSSNAFFSVSIFVCDWFVSSTVSRTSVNRFLYILLIVIVDHANGCISKSKAELMIIVLMIVVIIVVLYVILHKILIFSGVCKCASFFIFIFFLLIAHKWGQNPQSPIRNLMRLESTCELLTSPLKLITCMYGLVR